jgi:HK97 family phage major capsid protein
MHKALLASTALALIPAGAIFMMASPADRIAALESKREELLNASQAIIDGLGDDDDLSEEQVKQIQDNKADVEKIDGQISALQSLLPKGQGRKSQPENNGGKGNGKIEPQPRLNAGTGGFKNFGEFAQCVRAAAGGDQAASAQQRLMNAATTYGNEGTGADGGFAVPPDFRREIAEKVAGEGSLLARTDRLITSSNSMILPKDETTPWQTSGGILSYWEGEGQSMTETKLALKQDSVRLNKLTTLVKVTDELLDDAALLDSYLRRKAPVKMNAKLNTAIINGTGVGQPLGILRSGALVTVSKETSQAADSIYFENIVNMEARLYASNPDSVVWLINQNTLPQLMSMRFVRSATSPVPVWLPANGLAGQRFSTLMGKPVIPVQACPKLGDLGDIILADMSQYMTATKGMDIRTDVSIHLHFDQDITTYKFVMRVAGQPWWSTTITPQNASETLGAFVALAERT